MTAPAHTIAQAITDRHLYDPSGVRLHHLLYLAQGHHLGWFGIPLFDAAIEATDNGPHVVLEPDGGEGDLGEAELNTVGFVLSRYGRLPARDLATLIHSQGPYQLAEVARQPGQTAVVDLDVLRRHFVAAEAAERREEGISDEYAAAVSQWIRDAVAADDGSNTPDDLDRLRTRIVRAA